LTEDFDANQYVNTAINDPESSEAGDAATALAKLSFNVDSLEKQIKDQVSLYTCGQLRYGNSEQL
jgi:hypothetical protein